MYYSLTPPPALVDGPDLWIRSGSQIADRRCSRTASGLSTCTIPRLAGQHQKRTRDEALQQVRGPPILNGAVAHAGIAASQDIRAAIAKGTLTCTNHMAVRDRPTTHRHMTKTWQYVAPLFQQYPPARIQPTMLSKALPIILGDTYPKTSKAGLLQVPTLCGLHRARR